MERVAPPHPIPILSTPIQSFPLSGTGKRQTQSFGSLEFLGGNRHGGLGKGPMRWPDIMIKSNYEDRALNPAWIFLWPWARHLTLSSSLVSLVN